MSYTASNLPIGLSISGNSISGIPTVAGEYDISITASNAAGSDTKILVLTITGGGAGDTDGDTVPDNLDDYPDDPTRAFDSYYPNQVDFVSVAFEDLWPAYGDYDFNDFVVNLNYQTVTNAQNNVVDVIVKYQIMADGASLDNGFGIVFDADPAAIESVTGYIVMGNAIVYDAKGFEAGHTDETVVILIDNINPIMEGGMANTIPNGKYVQTTVNTVTTHFSTPQSAIGTPPYNPFIFVNQERGHEVHLKGQRPTEFVDEELFGTADDDSDMATESYYMSATGLPWGIETPINFDYPIESADILTAHLKFAAWAQSSGVEFQDWYMDKSGYRNDANIYVIP
jgi:LruC domain-containing protein